MNCITSVAPTICAVMGISPPSLSGRATLETVLETVKGKIGITHVDKCLVYAPDSIGMHLFLKHQSAFEKVLKHAPIGVQLCSVFPPKTPVCYASMFTGTLPEVHGIRKYYKPVLRCDTIFDALIRARWKLSRR